MQGAALQFPLAHPASLTIVSGARNGEQLKANAAWFEEKIPGVLLVQPEKAWTDCRRRSGSG